MGLFSKKSVPSLDTGRLLDISKRNANLQRDLVSQQFGSLAPLNVNFESKRTALGQSIAPQTENILSQYGQNLSEANKAEENARNAATTNFRAQAFRDVPAIQRAIRNSLGGNRLLQSGAAASTLANPITGAVQSAADFAANQENERLANIANRADTLANAGFGARTSALEKKLGLDEGTINQLTQMGRTDLIDKFNKLGGIQEQEGANELGIEQARQMNEIAKAQAANANRGGILSSLGSLAGLGIGAAFGGPLGAGIGSQIGGMAGGLAGGTAPQQFDPTLLFALSQRNPATQKYAVTSSLGRVPVGTGRYA